MGGPDSAVIPTSVAPGQTVDITIPLTSPTTAGTYRGYWKLKNNNGIPFGIGSAGTKSFWVEIKVTGTALFPVVTVTPGTPVTPATPIAGTVYDFVANVCAATWFSGAGQQPCPGIGWKRKRFCVDCQSLQAGEWHNRQPYRFDHLPQNINNGYIQGIYPSYKVKSGDKFRTIVNCENGATSCYVVFRLDYALAAVQPFKPSGLLWKDMKASITQRILT